MSSSSELLAKATSASSLKEKEKLYRSVLDHESATPSEKESAIVKLGELFRDAGCVRLELFAM